MSSPAPASIRPLIPPTKKMLTNNTANHRSSVGKVNPFASETIQPQILIVDGNAIIIVIVINTVRALLSIPTRYI